MRFISSRARIRMRRPHGALHRWPTTSACLIRTRLQPSSLDLPRVLWLGFSLTESAASFLYDLYILGRSADHSQCHRSSRHALAQPGQCGRDWRSHQTPSDTLDISMTVATAPHFYSAP